MKGKAVNLMLTATRQTYGHAASIPRDECNLYRGTGQSVCMLALDDYIATINNSEAYK